MHSEVTLEAGVRETLARALQDSVTSVSGKVDGKELMIVAGHVGGLDMRAMEWAVHQAMVNEITRQYASKIPPRPSRKKK